MDDLTLQGKLDGGKVKSLFKKHIKRYYKNKEVVLSLSSKKGNSLVWTRKTPGQNNHIPMLRGHTASNANTQTHHKHTHATEAKITFEKKKCVLLRYSTTAVSNHSE